MQHQRPEEEEEKTKEALHSHEPFTCGWDGRDTKELSSHRIHTEEERREISLQKAGSRVVDEAVQKRFDE